jgi:hypothetical protein
MPWREGTWQVAYTHTLARFPAGWQAGRQTGRQTALYRCFVAFFVGLEENAWNVKKTLLTGSHVFKIIVLFWNSIVHFCFRF